MGRINTEGIAIDEDQAIPSFFLHRVRMNVHVRVWNMV